MLAVVSIKKKETVIVAVRRIKNSKMALLGNAIFNSLQIKKLVI